MFVWSAAQTDADGQSSGQQENHLRPAPCVLFLNFISITRAQSAGGGAQVVFSRRQPPAPRPLRPAPYSRLDLDRRPRRHRAPHLVDFAIGQGDAAGGPVAEPLRAAEKSESV